MNDLGNYRTDEWRTTNVPLIQSLLLMLCLFGGMAILVGLAGKLIKAIF